MAHCPSQSNTEEKQLLTFFNMWSIIQKYTHQEKRGSNKLENLGKKLKERIR